MNAAKNVKGWDVFFDVQTRMFPKKNIILRQADIAGKYPCKGEAKFAGWRA